MEHQEPGGWGTNRSALATSSLAFNLLQAPNLSPPLCVLHKNMKTQEEKGSYFL